MREEAPPTSTTPSTCDGSMPRRTIPCISGSYHPPCPPMIMHFAPVCRYSPNMSRFHGTARALLLITPVIMSGASLAQGTDHATELRPIEQRIGDVGPLSISLRTLSQDFQVPVDFEHVRQLPGRRDQLVRSSGALHAVFSRSWYLDSPYGAIALVPPGTIFRIGSESLSNALAAPVHTMHHPHAGSNGDASAAPAYQHGLAIGASPLETPFQSGAHGAFIPPLRHDLPDLRRRNEQSTDVSGSRPEETGPRIAVDRDYRRHRFTALRDRALEHQAARGPSSPSSK